jgi:hypothetical protein
MPAGEKIGSSRFSFLALDRSWQIWFHWINLAVHYIQELRNFLDFINTTHLIFPESHPNAGQFQRVSSVSIFFSGSRDLSTERIIVGEIVPEEGRLARSSSAERKKLLFFNGLTNRSTMLHICTPFMEYGQALFEMGSIISIALPRLRDKRDKILNIGLEFLAIALNKPEIFLTALIPNW